jgi:rhamnulokinase
MNRYLAFDFGASSVRAIVGILENKYLKLNEVYRFPNKPIDILGSLYWNIIGLYDEVKKGIKKYVKIYGPDLDAIGIDTWGLDFVLLDKDDEPIGPFYCYRDKRIDGMLEQLTNEIPKKIIFKETGIQFMSVNASTQLYSIVKNKPNQLKLVETFLMIPDYINFLLSGKKFSEYSIATTSQLFNPTKNNWSEEIIARLGLKIDWFLPIISPGNVLGKIRQELAIETGVNLKTKIITPLCHDTGSAVAAVPVDMKEFNFGEWAYISSGTWSLMGVEIENPLINEEVLKYNFTNEGGFNGTIRLLKNITGLWLIQECKKIWDNKGLILNWQNIELDAKNSKPFKSFIDPNYESFINSKNMIEEIKIFCKKTNQKPPKKIGEFARTIFESLALKYKEVLDSLERITKTKIKILYIVGGGSENDLLNQFTANALNIPVIAGPCEATGIGNLLVQAIATGNVKNINELRQIVNNSFATKEYYPLNTKAWEQAYQRFLKIKGLMSS